MRMRGGDSLIAITITSVDMVGRGANVYWVRKAAVERLYLAWRRI